MSDANFAGPFFLDTNILIYSFDANAPSKRQIARTLIEIALQTQRGVISTQVAQEFLNVALRKFSTPLTVNKARDYLYGVLLPLCQHFPSIAFYNHALLIQQETGFAYYDTLIVTAAIEIGCVALLTEDMQTDRNVHGVKIINPFAAT